MSREEARPADEVTRRFPIPLPGGDRTVYLDVPQRLSEDDWEHLIHVLDAFRPGLVTEQAPADEERGGRG